MRWLHETDVLQGLAEEEGPIGQWARFHCVVRRVRAEEPDDGGLRGPVLLMGRMGEWRANMSVLEHAVAHGVIPSDRGLCEKVCRDGLSGPSARSCADTLIRLGMSLDRAELGQAARSEPEASTLPAWIVSVQPEAAEELVRNTDEAQLWASVALHLPTVAVDAPPLQVLERAAEALGLVLVSAGRGSARRQLARQLTPLAEAAGPGGALVMAALAADRPIPSWAVLALSIAAADIEDPVERYRVGGLDAAAVAGARAAGVDPLETGVAIEVGRLPPQISTSVAAQQALAARCPDWIPELLSAPENRAIGLDLARFTPTEEVLEALFAMPMPREPGQTFDLARALVYSGVPASVARVRQLADGLEDDQVGWLDAQLQSFFRQGI